ncbi:glutamyl-tRNA reductase [Syntrophotalea carbinolica DSM 2380]|uniref:Glutamyl-tRNA reductase n=1 Tax=Syntrophotalea carbinolica (strain DSM 2380 / NBRC 103641 / GraBd1) TaxID=338963 RepID=HEM1_SYNC1|nr:glutamyl-tRNA reductase [Syntrophotalea carbinolica]Q3A008.1 RecName: Full=Glutamyl-tRNA reductase; Short=GluTR [Syntrophotalea carbinolica DSM 2380]ABA90299.1 glutamyl-tRNA reductase [Syntrophotalea carbinolica DSM 2380]
MNFLVIGLSHKTAPVELRERISFSSDDPGGVLRAITALPGISEGMILSTCNRVEVYAASGDPAGGCACLQRFMAEHHGLDEAQLKPHLYIHSGRDAIRHLFRVASSLDSMILGEPQILGQLKEAYNLAESSCTAGPVLNRLLPRAFAAAKRVRNETAIAQHAVSVSYAAVELARKIFGDLAGKSVMIVGAGKMCELAARHLTGQNIGEVLVTNRTLARAQSLAEQFGGRAIPFAEFPLYLNQADIVLTSTAAGGLLLTRAQLEQIIRQRKNRPMFLIDIAVPRNIDPEVNHIDNVYLYDIDDLNGVIETNLRERRKAAKKAEDIIEQEIVRFYSWLRSLEATPMIVALRRQVEDIRRTETEKTLGSLQHLDAGDRRAVEALTRAIVNKVLHSPLSVLKRAGDDITGEIYLEAVRRLFDLNPDSQQTGGDSVEKDADSKQDLTS